MYKVFKDLGERMFELYRKQHIVTILKEKEKEKEKRGLSRLCSRCTIFQLGKTWV